MMKKEISTVKKIQQCIEAMEEFKDQYGTSFENACPAEFATINEALEKQIPKTPTNLQYEGGYVQYWNCPTCGTQEEVWINDYEWWMPCCPVCGQRVDWSKTEQYKM